MNVLVTGGTGALGREVVIDLRGSGHRVRVLSRKSGTGADWVQGNLVVTGVSPRPDATGEQFVTITGVINGPTVDEHVVYQQLAIDVEDWPSMGQLFPVMYAPNNPDRWTFAPPQA